MAELVGSKWITVDHPASDIYNYTTFFPNPEKQTVRELELRLNAYRVKRSLGNIGLWLNKITSEGGCDISECMEVVRLESEFIKKKFSEIVEARSVVNG